MLLAIFAFFCLPLPVMAVSTQITVAAAANVRFAMEALQGEFRKHAGTAVKVVYGSSGKLATQIREGAPFDVFVSADMEFADSLYRWGYARNPPRTYAYGKLVLWTAKDLDLSRGLAVLMDSGVGRIALADPRAAPYGREAVKALQRAGWHGKLKDRLVLGENIAQVSQYVLLGSVDAGFGAKAVVLAPEMAGKGKWVEVDSALYDRIAQGALVSKYGADKHPAMAESFHAFLYSDAARAVFAKYGYALP